MWWNLQDPHEKDWLVRRRVDIAGLQGWLGLRRSFDVREFVVPAGGEARGASWDAAEARLAQEEAEWRTEVQGLIP